MLYEDINPQQTHYCFPLQQILIMLMWGKNAKNSLQNKHFMSIAICSPISLSNYFMISSLFLVSAIDLKDKSINKTYL